MSVTDDIKSQYPTLAWLMNDPEVGKLLRDAVDPNKGFSPETFQTKLYQTKWFKSRSTSQRSMEILSHTDPGEYRRRQMAYRNELQALTTKLGFTLSNAQLAWISNANLSNGIEVGSPESINALRGFLRNQPQDKFEGAGSVDAAATVFRNISKNTIFLLIRKKHIAGVSNLR